ncbi:hypothetical protein KEM48_008662 [Puccinia striiformis f. sp. tritici PST-130]|nr:hypothetical protein KEM48_008662 [Puccinia striiformis f. sp. tritici PST-130]
MSNCQYPREQDFTDDEWDGFTQLNDNEDDQLSPPPAPASPLPSVNRIRPNRTKCIVIKLPSSTRVITGHVLYGVGKKFAIVSKNNCLGFATAAEAAYPFKPCLIKIIQPDPRVVPCNQARVSEGNKILILRNRNPEERAPLEQTQAQLATNTMFGFARLGGLQPNVVVTTPGRDHALALRDHHLGLRQERGAPAREGEFAMHLS